MKIRIDSISTLYNGITNKQEKILEQKYKLLKEKKNTYILINSLDDIINLPKVLDEEVILTKVENNIEIEIYDSWRE